MKNNHKLHRPNPYKFADDKNKRLELGFFAAAIAIVIIGFIGILA